MNEMSLMIICVFGLLLLGGIVALVALLANRKTRPVGMVFLLLGLAGLFVFGVAALFVMPHVVSVERQEAQIRHETEAVTRAHDQWQEAQARRSEMLEQAFTVGEEPDGALPDPSSPAPPAEGTEKPAPADGPGDDDDSPAMPDDTAAADTDNPVDPEPPNDNPPTGGDPADEGAEDEGATNEAGSAAGDTEPPDDETTADETPVEGAAPEEPPSWIDAADGYVNGVYQMVIRTDPLPNVEECNKALPDLLHRAIARYAVGQLEVDSKHASLLRLERYYIQRHIVKESWVGPAKVTVGPWVHVYVRLEFNNEVQDEVRQRCQALRNETVIAQRIALVVVVVVGLLALISVLFGYLKVDQATEGKYRGRLKLAAAVALLLVIAGFTLALEVIEDAYRQWPQQPATSPFSKTLPDTVPAADTAGSFRPISSPPRSSADHGAWRSGTPSTIVIIFTATALLAGGVALLFNRKFRVASLVALAVGIVILLVLVSA